MRLGLSVSLLCLVLLRSILDTSIVWVIIALIRGSIALRASAIISRWSLLIPRRLRMSYW